ncbi:MAG: DNA adenine methylase [Chloroflexi bacterium]|nr:DNA adenine methylase [Chloroflexota bacterium]
MGYPGGKAGAGVYQTIINQFPPHRIYVEPFVGGGAILQAKRPARCSIVIDADAHVAHAISGDTITIPNLTAIHGDGIAWLASNALSDDTLVYLDPPYLLSTRRQQRQIYRCELTRKDHERLLSIIVKLDCMVAISGYWSQLYEDELHGWRSITFTTQTRGGSPATEWLWMNYPEPVALHDYSYLGSNFRERERIKRKIARWRKRLQGMDVLERRALLVALQDVSTTSP